MTGDQQEHAHHRHFCDGELTTAGQAADYAVVRLVSFALDQLGQIADELIECSLEFARLAKRLRQKHAAVPKEVVVSIVDT